MKYLCLAYEEESVLDDLSPDDWDDLRRETIAYVDTLRANGHLLSTHALKSVRTAMTVPRPQRQTVHHRWAVCRNQGDAGRILPDRGRRSERGRAPRRALAVRPAGQHRSAPDRGVAAGGPSLRPRRLTCRFPDPRSTTGRRYEDAVHDRARAHRKEA